MLEDIPGDDDVGQSHGAIDGTESLILRGLTRGLVQSARRLDGATRHDGVNVDGKFHRYRSRDPGPEIDDGRRRAASVRGGVGSDGDSSRCSSEILLR